jgi:hypothetical protein
MPPIACLQGAYYFVTGLWSLVHIESFQKVTGRKTDLWLVKTVGALLVVIGSGLLFAAWTLRIDPALAVIAMGSAASLLAIELFYVSGRVIGRIYLADAIVEAGFVVAWGATWPAS